MNGAEQVIFFPININEEFLAIGVYFIAVVMAIALREFTHGWVKYVLATIFTISFMVLCYVAQYEYPPMNFILPGIVLVGVATGLWHWLRRVLREIRGE